MIWSRKQGLAITTFRLREEPRLVMKPPLCEELLRSCHGFETNFMRVRPCRLGRVSLANSGMNEAPCWLVHSLFPRDRAGGVAQSCDALPLTSTQDVGWQQAALAHRVLVGQLGG